MKRAINTWKMLTLARVMLAASIGVVTVGCGAEFEDPLLTDEETKTSPAIWSTLRSALVKGKGGVNGDTDYCNNGTCEFGEGDCDGGPACVAGLVCGINMGDRFGMPTRFWDVCVAPHCGNGVQDGDETSPDCGGTCGECECIGSSGDVGYCSGACQCTGGQGDCDVDADCLGALVCGRNVGDRFGMPGPKWDVCWPSHCADGLWNGDETAADCGGSCGSCS